LHLYGIMEQFRLSTNSTLTASDLIHWTIACWTMLVEADFVNAALDSHPVHLISAFGINGLLRYTYLAPR
jgi:hypothetical protein